MKKTVEPQIPQPTRFEWDEDLQDPTALKRVEDAFEILSYDKAAEITHPIVFEDDIPTVRITTTPGTNSFARKSSALSSPDSPPAKRPKVKVITFQKEKNYLIFLYIHY